MSRSKSGDFKSEDHKGFLSQRPVMFRRRTGRGWKWEWRDLSSVTSLWFGVIEVLLFSTFLRRFPYWDKWSSGTFGSRFQGANPMRSPFQGYPHPSLLTLDLYVRKKIKESDPDSGQWVDTTIRGGRGVYVVSFSRLQLKLDVPPWFSFPPHLPNNFLSMILLRVILFHKTRKRSCSVLTSLKSTTLKRSLM